MGSAAQIATRDTDWQACARIDDDGARLACYDRAARRAPAAAAPSAPTSPTSTQTPVATATVDRSTPVCQSTAHTALSRFWELEAGTDCGPFHIRGYRPISLAVVGADSINRQPTSDNPANNATTRQPYRSTETRLALSVRTKLWQPLSQGQGDRRDSLWFGYTQNSYWQLFNNGLSRPFRTTDHEPELIYVYPSTLSLGANWHLRYTSLSLNHQSNGQSLPLSRSWNRVILGAGFELLDPVSKRSRAEVQARVWQAMPEEPATDDNPGISGYVGRAELAGMWHLDERHTLAATLRHSLSSGQRGSVRLEWLRTIGRTFNSDLRLHTQLFTGYGDSLVDYNRRRTVLSLGLSLVDW